MLLIAMVAVARMTAVLRPVLVAVTMVHGHLIVMIHTVSMATAETCYNAEM